VAPSGDAVRVEGGVRVTGRWAYSSGIDSSAWVILNTRAGDSSKPDVKPTSLFVLVPAADYTIVDDWHVSGLRGSGSKSVQLTDVFVPDHRTESGLAINAGKTRGLAANSAFYRASFPGLFALGFATSAIGTAAAMVEEFRAYMSTRTAAYTGAAYKAKVGSWLRLAESSANVDAARLLLDRDLAALQHETLTDARDPLITERARYDVAYITELCARAVDRLFAGSGGRALYETSPLQRLFRDMHAITQHAATAFDEAGERYGQFLINDRTRGTSP
jgi:3-hydroxy-9,10-secoandrosta-1,3,5(10)-triene-9,17-dione monooxygenase